MYIRVWKRVSSVSPSSERLRANTRNVSFKTLYGGQLTLLTQSIKISYSVTLSHRRRTTVSLETYPLLFTICIQSYFENREQRTWNYRVNDSRKFINYQGWRINQTLDPLTDGRFLPLSYKYSVWVYTFAEQGWQSFIWFKEN